MRPALAQPWTYFVGDLPNNARRLVRLETYLEKWDVAGDLLEILGVDFVLGWGAAKGCGE